MQKVINMHQINSGKSFYYYFTFTAIGKGYLGLPEKNYYLT